MGTFGLRPARVAADQLDQLVLVDGTAAQLEIHGHVLGDRRGRLQGADVLGCGVDHADELVDVLPVAQRLDAAGGGAGSDGDQLVALAADLLDAARRRGGW